jgi:hypothetical protein
VSVIQKNPNGPALGLHAALFGDLAKAFKKGMVDSLDKPAKRSKTFERIQQFLIKNMFVYSDVVANGCGYAMTEILEHVFPEYLSTEVERFVPAFIDPLLAMLAPIHQNRAKMHSACFCIRRMLKFLVQKHRSVVTFQLSEYIVSAALVSSQTN